MWKPTTITFKNLLSHSHTKFDFISNQLIMLLGDVEDEPGADSNGAGKSAIIEAITLAITGNVWRDVGKEDFIKYGERSCVVIMDLVNDVLSEIMTIERTLFNNSSSSKLRIYINSEEITDLPTLNDGNKFILDKLGISKEDFLNYFVIGQGNNKSFFSAGDVKQKEIISRFSNFQSIDHLCDQIDNKINKCKMVSIPKCELSIERLDGAIENLKINIAEQTKNFEEEKKERLIQIKENIDKCVSECSKLKEKHTANKILITDRSSKIDALKLKIDAVDKIQQQLQDADLKRKKAAGSLLEVKKMQSELISQSGLIVKCPKCDNEFIPKSDLSPEEIQVSMSFVEENIKILAAQLISWDDLMDEIQERIQVIKENQSKINILQNEIRSYERLNNGIWVDIEELDMKRQSYQHQLKSFQDNKITSKESLVALKSKLSIQVSERIGQFKQLNELQKELEEWKFYQFHFSRQGFKTYLANKSIKSIQDICNFYLKRFETNLQVEISGFKILKSGELRDKIEVFIIKDGLNKGLFNKYSGGQKSRVDICGVIALNKLINNTVEYGKGLDLLIIDEIGYLDASGKVEVIKILEKSNVTSVIVMHEVGEVFCKNKVLVKYKFGNSEIMV